MRVGLDISALRTGATGVGYVVYHLWQALGRREDLTCVPLTPSMTVGTDAHPPAYRVHRWPTRLAWLQWDLPRALRTSDLDLVHFPNYLAPLRCPLPYVVHFHDLSVFRYPRLQPLRKRWVFRTLLGRIARSAACVVTVSHAMAREIAEYFRLPPERVAAVWNGYDPTFGPVGREVHQGVCLHYGLKFPFFLFVGAIHPRKNLETLLRAMAVVRRRGYPHHLVVVGPRGWQDGPVFRLWRRLDLEDRVHFLGYVPRADLVGLYNAAVALVYPSLYEGFGLPVVEAMACGTPVAASRIPALQEVGGPAVYWVDARDVPGWAEALARLADDPDLRDDLRAAGLERARLFSWDRTAEALARLYADVLQDSRPNPPMAPVSPELRPTDDGRLAAAVLKGLLYFALFKHPVTLRELHRSLPDRVVSPEALRAFLDTRPWPELQCRDGYYAWCENGESVENWLLRRRQREQKFEDLRSRYGRYARRLARLPYVRMVGLSGGGMFGTDVRDLDLFIVTRARRTALAYWLIVLWTRFRGVRSVLCANYFVDETALGLPEQDFYTAHQVVHLRPIVGYDPYLALWIANPWVARLFPNAHPWPPDETDDVPRGPVRWLERLLDALGAPLWNAVGLWLLRRRLGPKAGPTSALRLTPHVLKLHLHDYRAPVLDRLERLWQKTHSRAAACGTPGGG